MTDRRRRRRLKPPAAAARVDVCGEVSRQFSGFPFLRLIFLRAGSEGSFRGSTWTYFRRYFGGPRHYSRRTQQTSILAADVGGFNRLLLLLSFMFRYSQWVVQEGEVVAGWLARRAESLRVRVRPILRCRKWSLCTRQWRMPRNSWDPEVHGCSED